ncbi:hypothetical protein BS78_07G027200 [Paspalum vaginatum]|nr:hypothetical protein BS78_07G027200 [Paspalum vaginatum]
MGRTTSPRPDPRKRSWPRLVELGNGGVILVLFETPSGFAIFTYDGVDLLRPQAVENIWIDFSDGEMADSAVWLKEFQIFEGKASAINPVTSKLAVGKLEYKHIIEDKLGIACLFEDTVVELMWGLKNCMHHLLPGEKAELSKEDRRHMSQGMKIVLDRYKLEVNEAFIAVTGTVYCCDLRVNIYAESLRAAGRHLKEISNIDPEHWGLVKLAAALVLLCFPRDKLPCDPLKVFSQDEYDKLTTHGHMYEHKLLKGPCRMAFDELVSARQLRNRTLRGLAYLVREARKEYDEALASV